jgi:ATP-binding cassette subfamily B protein
MEDGRISAVGTHAELLAHNAHYRYVLASLRPEQAEDEQAEDEDDADMDANVGAVVRAGLDDEQEVSA